VNDLKLLPDEDKNYAINRIRSKRGEYKVVVCSSKRMDFQELESKVEFEGSECNTFTIELDYWERYYLNKRYVGINMCNADWFIDCSMEFYEDDEFVSNQTGVKNLMQYMTTFSTFSPAEEIDGKKIPLHFFYLVYKNDVEFMGFINEMPEYQDKFDKYRAFMTDIRQIIRMSHSHYLDARECSDFLQSDIVTWFN